MEVIDYFSDLFRKTVVPNLLTIGIVILIAWLLISGIRKGLRKTDHPRDTGEEKE